MAELSVGATLDTGDKVFGTKVDPITALQDDIDGLSLAMFEALRGLRDAVAPESGNLGGNPNNPNNNTSTTNNNNTGEPDMDELWSAYKNGDKDIVAQIHKVNGGIPLQKREDFIRIHAQMEMTKDTELVMKLASMVHTKSTEIDERVDNLPGMSRTKTEQTTRIQELIGLNKQALLELETAHAVAREKRDQCREFIRINTCRALAIEEELDE